MRGTGLAVGLIVAGLAAACAHGEREAPGRLTRGDRFEFSLPRLDGTKIRSTELEGKVVLVDVWATWCVPCMKSFPFYDRMKRTYSDQGFEVVAVSVDDRVVDVEAWLKGRDLPFIIAHDPEGTIPNRIGLRTMPSAFLLDRKGRVYGVHAGFTEADEPGLESMITSALQAAPPDSQEP